MEINPNLDNLQEPLTQAPPEVREIMERVLKIEKERLHHKSLRHINEDILKIVKDAVQ